MLLQEKHGQRRQAKSVGRNNTKVNLTRRNICRCHRAMMNALKSVLSRSLNLTESK